MRHTASMPSSDIERLDLLDAVLRQPRRRAADRAEIEAAVLGARPANRRRTVALASITSEPPAAWNWST